MKLFLIDGIGPFFRGNERRRINWSKIPFADLPLEPDARRERFDRIRDDLTTFTARVARLGFNAITFDDVAHLARHDLYEAQTRRRVDAMREEFRALFDIATRAGLAVYCTLDVMTYAPGVEARLAGSERRTLAFLGELVEGFLEDFPDVAGLILRIGESDGLDVEDHFRSRLFLSSPAMLNRCLRALLPVFERHRRRLILRTWTVGAYRVGDLIWHRGTFRRALAGLDSPALVISMKYGESDFFRHLPLNANFFRTPLPKIVELQARREYEGCGEYPSFVGFDHARYARELAQAPNMLGVSVWCQTGGWVPFRRLAFLDPGSPWTEINAEVTLRIFRDRQSPEDVLAALAPPGREAQMLEFFRLDDEVIKQLLYIEEFATRKLFFRRVRIPPLIGVYWSTLFVNDSLRKFLAHYVTDPEGAVRAGYAALAKVKRMQTLAADLGLPVEDVVYMKRTFRILAIARQYLFEPDNPDIEKRLRKAKRRYKKHYPKGTRRRYAVRLDFEPFRLEGRFLRWVLAVCLRRRRGYRVIDQVFTIHLLSLIYFALRRARPRMVPKFARKSAMGIDVVFR